MSKAGYSEEQLSEMREDAFVNIKEACMRLQERTSPERQPEEGSFGDPEVEKRDRGVRKEDQAYANGHYCPEAN